jgi:hypothetical protein
MENSFRSFDDYFGVVVKKQTYLNLFYLFISFPLGIFYFVFIITGLSLGFGLLVIFIGFIIIAAMFAAWYGLASLERLMAISLLNIEIPPMSREDNQSIPLFERLKSHLSNPVTWKSLAFLLLKFPMGIVSFTLLVTLLSITLSFFFAPITYNLWDMQFGFWWIDTLSEALILFVISLFFGPLALHILNGLAMISGKLAQIMLGKLN